MMAEDMIFAIWTVVAAGAIAVGITYVLGGFK